MDDPLCGEKNEGGLVVHSRIAGVMLGWKGFAGRGLEDLGMQIPRPPFLSVPASLVGMYENHCVHTPRIERWPLLPCHAQCLVDTLPSVRPKASARVPRQVSNVIDTFGSAQQRHQYLPQMTAMHSLAAYCLTGNYQPWIFEAY